MRTDVAALEGLPYGHDGPTLREVERVAEDCQATWQEQLAAEPRAVIDQTTPSSQGPAEIVEIHCFIAR
jgi:hypothetical protein